MFLVEEILDCDQVNLINLKIIWMTIKKILAKSSINKITWYLSETAITWYEAKQTNHED